MNTTKDPYKIRTMISTNGNRNLIFFEENPEKGKVFYSLVNQEGETLRKGSMSISMEIFVDYMQKIGFKYLRGEDLR